MKQSDLCRTECKAQAALLNWSSDSTTTSLYSNVQTRTFVLLVLIDSTDYNRLLVCTSLLLLPHLHLSEITVAMCRCVFSSSLHTRYSSWWTLSVCACFLWSPSRCLGATLLIRQAEEKLSVFLLRRLQPLLHSCEQVPKLEDLC